MTRHEDEPDCAIRFAPLDDPEHGRQFMFARPQRVDVEVTDGRLAVTVVTRCGRTHHFSARPATPRDAITVTYEHQPQLELFP